MTTRFMRLSLLVVLLVSTFGIVTSISQAQQNLLLNPSFDQAGTPRSGFDGVVPIGWEGWSAGYTLFSDTDAFPAHVRSAPHSWIIRRDYAEFTGGGYQTVNVEANKTYQFSIYTYIWTCNDTTGSCITGEGTFSQPESGGKVRIGLDPTGGTDPNSPSIIWTPFATPHQQVVWQQLSISAQATGPRMTAWLYFNSTTPMRWQEVHFDDAMMVEVGGTGIAAPPAAGTGTPVAVAPPPLEVPFVTAQQPRPDGSLIHVVVSGDTINSIVVAYQELGVTRDVLTRANNWRFPPQFIGIGDEIVILPPGSLDPNSGALTPAGQAFIEGGEAPAEAPPAAEPTQPTVEEVPVETTPTAPVVQEVPVEATPTAPVVQEVPAEDPAAEQAAAPVTADGAGPVQPIDSFLPVGSIAN